MGEVLTRKRYDWDAAWHLFMAGATLEEIGEKMEIPYKTVVDFSSSRKWVQRRMEALQYANVTIKKDLAKRIEKNRAKHQHFVMDQLEESEEHISQLIVKKQDDSPFAIGMPLGQKLSILKQHDDIARRTYKLDEIEEHDPVRQGFALLVALQPNKQILVNDVSENLTLNEPAEIESETLSYPNSGEEIVRNVVELGPDFIPVKPIETTPSGIQVFQAQTEAFAGILSPLNGHINASAKNHSDAMEEVGNVIQPVREPESGGNSPSKEQKEFEERTPRVWQMLQADRARREQKGKEEPAATVEQVSNGIKPLPKNLY